MPRFMEDQQCFSMCDRCARIRVFAASPAMQLRSRRLQCRQHSGPRARRCVQRETGLLEVQSCHDRSTLASSARTGNHTAVRYPPPTSLSRHQGAPRVAAIAERGRSTLVSGRRPGHQSGHPPSYTCRLEPPDSVLGTVDYDNACCLAATMSTTYSDPTRLRAVSHRWITSARPGGLERVTTSASNAGGNFGPRASKPRAALRDRGRIHQCVRGLWIAGATRPHCDLKTGN